MNFILRLIVIWIYRPYVVQKLTFEKITSQIRSIFRVFYFIFVLFFYIEGIVLLQNHSKKPTIFDKLFS